MIRIPPEVIKPKKGETFNQRSDLTEQEKERITKGQEHWKSAIPKTLNGGYVTNDTMEILIDAVVDDVWSKAKDFYTKEKEQ